MTAGDRYATPAAFRRALTDRLKEAAKDGPWTLQQLQRQVAYDRLLDRLYLVDDGWIVEGRPHSGKGHRCQAVSTSTSTGRRLVMWQRPNCAEPLP